MDILLTLILCIAASIYLLWLDERKARYDDWNEQDTPI